jgi:predicted small secreted protein
MKTPKRIAAGILLAAFLLLACFFVSGCGSPVALTGAYENPQGERFEAGASFTLPNKKGLKK